MTTALPRIEIPLFPQGKRIAVTTSWDDGTIHDRPLVAAMNEYGLKGTFNLNSASLARPGVPQSTQWHNRIGIDEVAKLYAGHEVAIHTSTHPHLEHLDASQIAAEVLEDRKALEDLVGYPVRGMAYPFGTYNEQVIQVLRALGVVYSRTTENKDNPWPAQEPLRWPSTSHIFAANPKTVAERFADAHANGRFSGLFYVWGHSYEFNDRNDWAALERLLKPLAGKSDVWYCTNIQLFDYEDARKRMIIAANRRTACNPSTIPVTLRVGGNLIDVAPGELKSL